MDAITKCAITKLENVATGCLKGSWGFLEVPPMLYSTILMFATQVFHRCPREAKLSVLSCTSSTGDPQLQQLGLQLHLGDEYLQIQAFDYHILSKAHLQSSSFPTTCSLTNCLRSILVMTTT